MFEMVQRFLTQMSDEFLAGDVDAVYGRLSLPTAIFFGCDVVLVKGKKDLANLTQMYLDGLRQNGVTKSLPVLNCVSLPKNGKIVAMRTSLLEDKDGNRVGESKAKYYLRITANGLKVDLVEHSQAPLGSGEVHDALKELAI